MQNSTNINEQKFHIKLSNYNQHRLVPNYIDEDWSAKIQQETAYLIEEGEFVESQRLQVQKYLVGLPTKPKAFIKWFENLKVTGPGQGDILFPWLAEHATLEQMRWFLRQEAAGEAGFEDLVAITQVKLPVQAKLEMARNYWDEMGRGHERGMHGPMLATVVKELKLNPKIEETVWESLAQANMMLAMAVNRRYAYQSVGALGVIEMTAPTRVGYVNEGLKRLNVSLNSRKYFQLHATLDIRHSEAWNEEVLYSLVKTNPNAAKPIAEGALMRLMCGARCFDCYRAHFGISSNFH
jgi:hypothetical protein